MGMPGRFICGMLYKNMHEAIDGDQIVEFFSRQSVDVAKEIVS